MRPVPPWQSTAGRDPVGRSGSRASSRSPEDGRGRTLEGTPGSTPAPRPRHPAHVSRAGFLTSTLQGPMGAAGGDAPPRDRPGLLFLTYAVPAFFAWGACWLGTRCSGLGSSTGVAWHLASTNISYPSFLSDLQVAACLDTHLWYTAWLPRPKLTVRLCPRCCWLRPLQMSPAQCWCAPTLKVYLRWPGTQASKMCDAPRALGEAQPFRPGFFELGFHPNRSLLSPTRHTLGRAQYRQGTGKGRRPGEKGRFSTLAGTRKEFLPH